MNWKAESVLWPVAYLRDCLHGSSLMLCAVQNLLGDHCWDFTGNQTRPWLPHTTHSSWIQQFSWSSAPPQSRAVTAAITQSWGQAEAGPVPGLVLCSHLGPAVSTGGNTGQPTWKSSSRLWKHLAGPSLTVPAVLPHAEATHKPQCPTVQFHHATCSAFRTTNWNRGTLQFCLSETSFLPVSVFKILPLLTLNTVVAHHEASSLGDKQLNLHFYLTCTLKISSYFIMRGIEVLT